jgi:hypothetical protein
MPLLQISQFKSTAERGLYESGMATTERRLERIHGCCSRSRPQCAHRRRSKLRLYKMGGAGEKRRNRLHLLGVRSRCEVSTGCPFDLNERSWRGKRCFDARSDLRGGWEGFPKNGGRTTAYCDIALPTCENTLLALPPIRRTVPITITRITASITAYSATSCPCSSTHN